MSTKTLLPNNIRDIFESIESEIIWLHSKWKIYRQLYGTNEERINQLNRSASTFFRLVQDVLFNDIVLSISRLTDPSKTFGRDNRSLEQLITLIDEKKHPDLIQILREKLNNLKTQSGPFRKRRNKKIAHSDLLTALSIQSEPLPDISRQSIENALEITRDFMNQINIHFVGIPTAYEHLWLDNDGETIISILDQFWTYKDTETLKLKFLSQPEKKGLINV